MPRPVTVTFLEILEAPADPGRTLPADAAVMRARRPTVAFYRWLYHAVGSVWDWTDRTRLSDAALEAEITPEAVELWVLYRDGTPIGYAELDARRLPDVHLAYFGLVPEAIGQGYGASFLDWTVRRGWAIPGARRLWLTTCSLDHPRALEVYEKAGFVPYRALDTLRPTPEERRAEAEPARPGA